MRIEWSVGALADLDRFADFLQSEYPTLSATVGREIYEAVRILETNPRAGHRYGASRSRRQIVLEVLRAKYVVRYRIRRKRIEVFRVFHGKEWRRRTRRR